MSLGSQHRKLTPVFGLSSALPQHPKAGSMSSLLCQIPALPVSVTFLSIAGTQNEGRKVYLASSQCVNYNHNQLAPRQGGEEQGQQFKAAARAKEGKSKPLVLPYIACRPPPTSKAGVGLTLPLCLPLPLAEDI